MRLMHVEDDEDIREVALMALEFSGKFEVLQCSTPEEALEKAAGFMPEVLLLDVMMPGMTGPAVLQKLRLIPGIEDTPAIFMTARAQPSEVEELTSVSAIAVVVKPFDPITLGDQIMAALEKGKC